PFSRPTCLDVSTTTTSRCSTRPGSRSRTSRSPSPRSRGPHTSTFRTWSSEGSDAEKTCGLEQVEKRVTVAKDCTGYQLAAEEPEHVAVPGVPARDPHVVL